MIEKRIIKLPQAQPTLPPPKIVSASEISAKFGRQFQTSADGTYAFLYSCNFPGDNNKILYDRKFTGTSIDYCARACEDQRNICDHFVMSSEICYLKKNPTGGVYIDPEPTNFICGVMTNLPRSSPTAIPNFNNVEFMPSKCNHELISTTTIQTDSLSPNDSYEVFV